MFQDTAERHHDAPALTGGDGTRLTWGAYADAVRTVAGALRGVGMHRGDVLACWLRDRPEFHVADAAAMHLGVRSFSLYDPWSARQAEQVLAETGATLVVTEAAFIDRVIAIRDGGRTALRHIVCVDGDAPEALGWDELPAFADDRFDFAAAWGALDADDVAALVYTPGTTGPPRGVRLTHANIVSQVRALFERLGLAEGMRVASIEPAAHIRGRLTAHYLPMLGGWHVWCGAEPVRLAEVRPTHLLLPVAAWGRLRGLVTDGATLDDLGLDAVETALASTGPCPPDLLAFWRERGVALTEVYATSESGPAAIDGRPLGPCELRVGDGGALLVRGPVVSPGYVDGLTVAGDDGWFDTGDAATVEGDRLSVCGRRGEQFVGAGGATVSPERIEALLQSRARLIEHACVIGADRPYNVALITLRETAARAVAGGGRLRRERLVWSRRVVEAVQHELRESNCALGPDDRIRRFTLVRDSWRPGGVEVTPAGTLRRRSIAEAYAQEVQGLYDGMLGVDV